MLDWLLLPFVEFDFMRRAFAGCCIMALGGAPVGVFMTLRRMSLTGDAMAHAILPGAAIGYLVAGLSLGAMTVGGIVAGLCVALLSGLVTRSSHLQEDTNLAAFYLMSLALGVLLISTRGGSVDLDHVLFGSILALEDATLLLLASIATVSVFTLFSCYRPLVMECCDPGFLRVESRLGPVVHLVFLALVVLNLVAGFHALGTLMAVGMLILPAAAARFWVRELGPTLALAVLVSFIGSSTGLLISYYIDAPTSATIIFCLGALYLLSFFAGSADGHWLRWWPREHLQA
jgi:zinc/manganese transport system permease protein